MVNITLQTKFLAVGLDNNHRVFVGQIDFGNDYVVGWPE